MSVLVVAEHDNQSVKSATLNTVAAAAKIGGELVVLVAGSSCGAAAKAAAAIPGVKKVLVADAPHYKDPRAENLAPLVVDLSGAYTHVLLPANSFGKNLAPRLAALLDVAQISDIVSVVSADTFVRPIYAGNALATVQSKDKTKIITVRTTGFDAVSANGGSSVVEALHAGADSGLSSLVGRALTKSERPELTSARVVVSGGRGTHFVRQELAGLAEIAKLPGCEEINAELVDQILEESAKFANEVLSPLNKPADKEGSNWDKGKVTTPKGFKEAYRLFVEAGWNALQAPAEHGGQGLPKIVSTPVVEMWKSANLSFSLVTMLTAGAVEALILRGTEEQKKQYLPKMIAGTWTGTMNLTEPQAGSDLGLVRTRAVRGGDHYRVSGQKIFITYGEHDLAENIVHLVLGRVEGAPEGGRGISLLLVPNSLVNADGSLRQRNEVQG